MGMSTAGDKSQEYYLGSSYPFGITSGAGAVDSVFGRIGAVTAQSGDYTASQVTFNPAGNDLVSTESQSAIVEATGYLVKITENSQTGFSVRGADRTYKGDIGVGAIDLSSATNGADQGATGLQSLAIGTGVTASGEGSVIIGSSGGVNGVASGIRAFVFGYQSSSSGNNSLCSGSQNVITHNKCMALGEGLKTAAVSQAALGKWNDPAADDVFTVGSGTSDVARANSMEVKGDGTARLPKATTALITNAKDVVIKEKLDADIKALVYEQGHLMTTPSGGGNDEPVFIPDEDITITKVRVYGDAGTMTFNVNSIFTSNQNADTNIQSYTPNDGSVTAGTPVIFSNKSSTSSPLWYHITIYYTKD